MDIKKAALISIICLGVGCLASFYILSKIKDIDKELKNKLENIVLKKTTPIVVDEIDEDLGNLIEIKKKNINFTKLEIELALIAMDIHSLKECLVYKQFDRYENNQDKVIKRLQYIIDNFGLSEKDNTRISTIIKNVKDASLKGLSLDWEAFGNIYKRHIESLKNKAEKEFYSKRK